MNFWPTLYNVVDHVSTSLAVPLAVVGFWIAIRQINKTKSAAESARDAALAAKQDINRAGVLVLLPQLQRTEEHIETAVKSGSTDLFIAWANVWRWQASQFRGHLEANSKDHAKLTDLLQKSVYLVATAKSSVIATPNGDLTKGTRRALESIAAVTSELGGLVAVFGSHTKSEVDNG